MDPNLSLRVERLTELTTEELYRLRGAAAEAQQATTALRECLHTIGCTTMDTCPIQG